jgi:hypothetical protein
MRIYMLARYRRRKAEAIKRLGGKCVVCGSRQRLQFDHVERRSGEDSFVITKRLVSVAESKLDEELAKCQLLCFKHHHEKTLKELGRVSAIGTHGTVSSYKYCSPPRCAACKLAWSESHKRWKDKQLNTGC